MEPRITRTDVGVAADVVPLDAAIPVDTSLPPVDPARLAGAPADMRAQQLTDGLTAIVTGRPFPPHLQPPGDASTTVPRTTAEGIARILRGPSRG